MYERIRQVLVRKCCVKLNSKEFLVRQKFFFNKGVWKLSRLNVKQLGLVLRERGGWTEMLATDKIREVPFLRNMLPIVSITA